MAGSETSHEISERPSSIVRIAYHQLSVMCGTHDPTAPVSVTPINVDDERQMLNATTCDMVCTRRLLGLPMFVSMTSTFCNAYNAAKNSHESIALILDRAENGMHAGLKFARPVTNGIASALETPLKAVDNVVCVGLDFAEERMPSVKLPPDQIYVNMKDNIRNIFTSALETLRLLFGPKNRIEVSSAASETTRENSDTVVE